MSLFASSFQDPSAGPSLLSAPVLGKQHKDGNKKRKRASAPFTGGGGTGSNRLQITESNFHKVMKKVDGGEFKEKDRAEEGSMDMGGQKKKEKPKVEMKGKGARGRAMANLTSGAPPPVKKIKQSQVQFVDKKEGKKARKEVEMDEDDDEEEEEDVRMSNGRFKPAELPLPHDIAPKSGKKNKSGDESLTDMQRGMQAKLEGARFRWINEQLYSNPSTEAVSMMKKDPKIFEDYHQTHRALTSAWPSPPLPILINLLTPLPPKTLIVDLGCGDAGLAKALVPQGKIVMSYDLVGDSGSPGVVLPGAGGGWVVEADFLEGVPLPGRPGGSSSASNEAEAGDEVLGRRGKKAKNKSKAAEASEIVDVVVCCLSLMGVNWVGGIYEACRILREGGTFHIAEVTSRFISIPAFVSKVQSFGFKLQSQKAPSTHFTLFEFTKESAVPLGAARGEDGWTERVAEGEEILRGCVYKKR